MGCLQSQPCNARYEARLIKISYINWISLLKSKGMLPRDNAVEKNNQRLIIETTCNMTELNKIGS